MQIVSNLQEMPNPVFWEKYENYFNVICWKIYPERLMC